MDNIYYEKVLSRILQGRLRIKRGDLVLYVYEPTQDLIEESFDIYEETRHKCWINGCYVDREIQEMLIDFDLWSPIDAKRLKELEDDELENAKVDAYKSFFDKQKLRSNKRKIRRIENEIYSLRGQKAQFDHLSCDGIAAFVRKSWLFERSTKLPDGSLYDFSEMSVSQVIDKYASAQITSGTLRHIARSDPWRSMWSVTRKRDNPFDVKGVNLNDLQLGLCSWTIMYENLYENPDHPKDEIIEDDDCLDGWFVLERRKREKEAKERQAEELLGNEKIANSQEVFLMANNQQQAKDILDLNNSHGKNVIANRNAQIEQAKQSNFSDSNLHFKNLSDVSQDRYMNAVNTAKEATKRRN